MKSKNFNHSFSLKKTAATLFATASLFAYSNQANAQNTVVAPTGQKITVNAPATSSATGLVQLAGDLSGTAASPAIASGAITSAKILDATIAAGDLADGAVTSAKILDATIAVGDLADGAVTSAKILDATIATGDLANNAVTSAIIANAAVTTAKIANGTALQILRTNSAGTAVEWAAAPVTITPTEQVFTATAGQTAFTLTNTPLNTSIGSVTAYINGTKINNTAFTLAGAVVTYVPASNGAYALVAGDIVTFTYLY